MQKLEGLGSDLHGVPWFNEGVDQIQVEGWFLDLWGLAARLVA